MTNEAKERQKASIKAWHEANYCTMAIHVRKEDRARYQRLAEDLGTSVRAMILNYLEAECKKNGI